ncbi:cytochrome P450 [Lederbergia galactosidilytica]|uniref:Cytochrome P450 n=1 Tax=Lederbergia galactosidilytica TaxID=217031 RepID=A0A177ZV42_9BACI|nr:cytochrome P450 [Lederbergia galactosidilytica]KRG13738.1 cytochrome P450 [Virgibacillus soli]MBP1917159.1 cytochrome P450 [Lederbergia galactosidilytica]OAK70728.1 cytochrome P450 [Lederbergia galactosidilytica]
MRKEIVSLKEVKKFQTRSEEFFPLQWYKDMLTSQPIYFDVETNTWNVFKYEDVKQVLSNYEFFSSEGPKTTISVGANNKEGTIPDNVNIMVDPPVHRKRRSLLSAAFTPRSLKNWEPRIERIVTELIEGIEENSTVDIVQALAAPLPGMVIAELFGVPIEDRRRFKHWVDVLFLPYDKENQQEIELKKQAAAKEYYQYLYPIVLQKRLDPSEDILSDLIKAEVDGDKLTDDEIVRITMALLGAGVETTSHALANTFYSLLYDDPSLYKELRNDLELVPKAVEEMLRYRFHNTKRDRTVKQDNCLLGPEMKKGEMVIAWMSAANMDEAMFADPLSLNIHRPNNKKHLTFGKGPHFCLGAPLARLELTLTLKGFLQKFSRIESVESFDLEGNLTESATGQSLTHLPMKVYK